MRVKDLSMSIILYAGISVHISLGRIDINTEVLR